MRYCSCSSSRLVKRSWRICSSENTSKIFYATFALKYWSNWYDRTRVYASTLCPLWVYTSQSILLLNHPPPPPPPPPLHARSSMLMVPRLRVYWLLPYWMGPLRDVSIRSTKYLNWSRSHMAAVGGCGQCASCHTPFIYLCPTGTVVCSNGASILTHFMLWL